MCCLFGLVDTRHSLSGREKSKILHILASESEARGIDATGVAYNLGNQLYIHKRPIPGHKLQIRVCNDTAAVMGHTRMTTQGRASRNKNNHPFFGRTDGIPFALAHNGMLFNDNQLRRTLKLPKTKIETDTYIAVQILEQRGALNFDSLRYMAEQVEGSFTFTVLDRSNNLYIVKGDSPMCLYWFPEYGVYLYDSTEEILNKALQRSGLSLGTPTRISLSCGEILQISSSGEISRGEFDNPYLYYSHWSPYYWSDKCSSTRQKFQPYLDGYLNMIKSIAMAFGYFPEDIDQLCDLGFTPEEIEEYLYGRNLWEEI